jgi:hypothetical protein
MEQDFEQLKNDEVINIQDHSNVLRQRYGMPQTFKVDMLVKSIEKDIQQLLDEGLLCEVMRLDRPGWQVGEIRLRKLEVEFRSKVEISSADDSSLDELRNSEV